MSQAPTLYPPVEVQRQLGVSASGLRRLARIYEGVLGDLPRDSAGGRLWPEEAVKRLQAARTAQEAGRADSVAEALAAPELDAEGELPAESIPTDRDVLLALVAEVKALRKEIGELRSSQKLLEAPQENEPAATVGMRAGQLLVRLRQTVRGFLGTDRD